jgi:hypothetical protein
MRRAVVLIMFDFTAVMVATLAVWRVTHLLVVEDGPWNVFAHLRRIAATLRLDRLASCFYCASVWIAIPFALLLARDWRTIAIAIPALSGGAVLLERITTRDEPAQWFEEEKPS